MAIGELRRGTELIKKAAEGGSGGGRYTPFISIGKDETKLLYFITPMDAVPKIQMHNFVRKVVQDDEGNDRDLWLTFMCRKDEAWRAESGGKCQLCDEVKHNAQERFVALAVELEAVQEGKTITGVKIKYRTATNSDGDEVDYPQVGLVVQGSKNFFRPLLAWDERRDGIVARSSWEVTREGEKLDTTYIFMPLEGQVPDLSEIEESIPKLEEVLENLGSIERYERELEGVRPEDQPTYGDRKGKKKKQSSSRTSAPSHGDTIFEKMRADIEAKQKSEVESY